jgi:hypothetical protein
MRIWNVRIGGLDDYYERTKPHDDRNGGRSEEICAEGRKLDWRDAIASLW